MTGCEIILDKELFKDLQGEGLLLSICTNDLDGVKEQLHTVLDRIAQRTYGPEENKQSRKSRKWERIDLYNNLLLHVLEAEGADWKLWAAGESAQKLWAEKTRAKLVPESIYAYLLDHIHEDEEIMFKYYHVSIESRSKFQKDAFFLVESIKIYRIQILVLPVVKALKEWPKKGNNEEFCKQLLDTAKEVFKEKVSSHGRRWSERSWRNRARLYWLLDIATHAPISNGRLPIGTLVREMIEEDEEMLFEKNEDSLFGYREKAKFAKQETGSQLLGHFKVSRLLAWASATSFYGLVKCILQHRDEYLKRDDCNWEWEDSWKNAWADALWNAAYKGNAQIVNLLLHCSFPYHDLYWRYYSKEEMHPPLHVAVLRGHISVVEAFCTESRNFSCHEKSVDKRTPLEVAGYLTDKAIKRKIQGILLQRSEVKQAVDESYRQRELAVGSANAIVVGATLIAGVTYGGWLQPPLGYNSYQFTEPLPAPPDSYESYMSIQGHTTIQVFAVFNSLSFFFAIAAIIAGMETTYFTKALNITYIANTVRNLQVKLRRTTILFIASVISVLIAFASAGIAILPPIKRYQWTMYTTIAVGGAICMVFIVRMLLLCNILAPWKVAPFKVFTVLGKSSSLLTILVCPMF